MAKYMKIGVSIYWKINKRKTPLQAEVGRKNQTSVRRMEKERKINKRKDERFVRELCSSKQNWLAPTPRIHI